MGTLLSILFWLTVAFVIWLAYVFMKSFDKIAGRGPKQVSDGIGASGISKRDEGRVPCAECAELILPDANKCRFCGAVIYRALRKS